LVALLVRPARGRVLVAPGTADLGATLVVEVVADATVVVVVASWVTWSVAEMPTVPPPQRTPMLWVSGRVAEGIVYVAWKLPLASRAACGPNPSGGNRSSVDVSWIGSSEGHDGVPLTGTLPEMVTVLP
jgi:hypothetical protein